MSSINPHFTFQYSQPSEYRFSHDSVFLARQAFEQLSPEQLISTQGLDLCAGCGIVGLDFLFHCRETTRATPLSMDFMEVQSVYQSHFETNRSRLGAIDTKTAWLECNYEILQTPEFSQRYNLILCNPPYFFANQGRLSPSQFKNRCRFYLDSDFPNLIRGLAHSLTADGQVFMLLRDLPEHRWQAQKETQTILDECGSFRMDVLGTIRGTPWVRITASPN